MGVVYLARDPRIGRQVALKTIHLPAGLSRSEESQYRERFRREGMAAGKLNHPNIVTVYDVGEDPDSGVSVIVMEHIEGVTLKERLDSGSLLSEQEIRRIGAQIAEALDYAHRQKVIHRDIKPANIILTREGDAKIMDFGIARLADSELTHEEQTIGSPAFMSPEQIRGDRVRAASDLFSLGVLLYMLATGRRPFEGTDTASIMYKILNENPVPPSQVPAPKRPRRKKRKNSSSLSAEFDQILGQLLRKNPSERFSTGRELAE
ncbi:MAG: serine/threonine-protein kinase, partial [Acidobacteriota bacterium]